MRTFSSITLLALAILGALELTEQGVLGAPPGVGYHLIGANHCSRGPGYWCGSHANAKECGMLDWCVSKQMLPNPVEGTTSNNKVDKSDNMNDNMLLGANHCSSGPGYWCGSHANAKECGMLDWCVTKQMLPNPVEGSNNNNMRLGANHCSRGPGYWCGSHASAKECGMLDWCVTRKMLPNPVEGSNNNMRLGSNICSRGPGYWCGSHANAKECGMLDWCITKQMLNVL